MKFVLIMAVMFLGVTAAQGQQQRQQGQTVLQFNGQANSSGSFVGSDPLSTTTSPSSSAATSSSSSPSSASTSGAASGSASTGGSASGATGASAGGSGNSQSPVLLPGEIPDTSTQAASTTAAAPGSSSTVCPPPVPSTDGGSVNLTEIAGASLGGC
jgi:hypothetical protein